MLFLLIQTGKKTWTVSLQPGRAKKIQPILRQPNMGVLRHKYSYSYSYSYSFFPYWLKILWNFKIPWSVTKKRFQFLLCCWNSAIAIWTTKLAHNNIMSFWFQLSRQLHLCLILWFTKMLINFQNDVLPSSIIQMWTNYAQEITIWNNIIKVQRKNCTQCNCAEICHRIYLHFLLSTICWTKQVTTNYRSIYKHFEEARFK